MCLYAFRRAHPFYTRSRFQGEKCHRNTRVAVLALPGLCSQCLPQNLAGLQGSAGRLQSWAECQLVYKPTLRLPLGLSLLERAGRREARGDKHRARQQVGEVPDTRQQGSVLLMERSHRYSGVTKEQGPSHTACIQPRPKGGQGPHLLEVTRTPAKLAGTEPRVTTSLDHTALVGRCDLKAEEPVFSWDSRAVLKETPGTESPRGTFSNRNSHTMEVLRLPAHRHLAGMNNSFPALSGPRIMLEMR